MRTSIRRLAHHPLARVTAGCALAATLVGWTARTLAIASFALSPADVNTGAGSTATVTLDDMPIKAMLTLTSSNTAVATVPPSLTIAGTNRVSFAARSVAGATGCSRITAQLGTGSSRSAVLAVHPTPTPSASAVKLSIPDNTVASGQTATGRVMLPTAQTSSRVLLTSSDPAAATVPASVQVPLNTSEIGIFGLANFSIQTSSSGVLRCVVITATQNGVSSRALLKIFPISG
jgi:hypothetical protein